MCDPNVFQKLSKYQFSGTVLNNWLVVSMEIGLEEKGIKLQSHFAIKN